VLVDLVISVGEDLDEPSHVTLDNVADLNRPQLRVVSFTLVYSGELILMCETLVHISIHEGLVEGNKLCVLADCGIIGVLKLLPNLFNPILEFFVCVRI